MFEIKSLSYQYPSGRTGLQDISLEGGPGERIVLMGPNGSGKSTLLRSLATELLYPKGPLVIFGQPIFRNLQEVRRKIGFAGDHPIHLPSLTGMENAQLFTDLYGLERKDAGPVLENLFAIFGLSKVKDVPVGSYSHGMKKKLQLVESLAHNPKLIILDEPTLGLDPSALEAFVDSMNHNQNQDSCIVLATNHPELATKVATSVVFMVDGAIVVQGSPAELLQRLDNEAKVEIWTSGTAGEDIVLEGIRARVFSDRIIANMPTDVAGLPILMEKILDVGLVISKVEITRPDLADVFGLLTGTSLENDHLPRAGS
ncbi:MAG: ABC transporter ATP-binding protein [Longimicrobiales bacterium]|nr:ABC transporter ATP-binding protein [Longimicrobiales bacterium]